MSILQGLVLVGVVGVLAFDGLSCFINDGLADNVAEEAASRASDDLGGAAPSPQLAYDVAQGYLNERKPGYQVLPETVVVDPQEKVVSLAIRGEAPTLVFKRFEFSKKWTVTDGAGQASFKIS